MAVGHDLKFNVAWIEDELFQIDLIVSECFLRLMASAMKSGFKTWLVMRSAHPSTAAAGSRFYHHRVAKSFCDFHRVVLCLDNSIAAGRYGHAGFACSRTSSVLIAHRLHRTRGRSDELAVAAFADFHEMRILGEKSVARMNRVNVADLGGTHNPIDSQITLKTGRRTDADRFVGQLDMKRINVRFRIDRQRANAEFFAGADHPQRDLSAVSNQYFFEHVGRAIRRTQRSRPSMY